MKIDNAMINKECETDKDVVTSFGVSTDEKNNECVKICQTESSSLSKERNVVVVYATTVFEKSPLKEVDKRSIISLVNIIDSKDHLRRNQGWEKKWFF